MLITHKHHHLEWGTYLAVMSVFGALIIFAGMLLQDCARIMPKTLGGFEQIVTRHETANDP
jgi:hypothetical protein